MDERAKERLKKKRKSHDRWLIVILVLGFLYCNTIGHPRLLNAKRSGWESRAKSTLRDYGETQLAFQNVNPFGAYASWDKLVYYDFIEDGYTGGNIISNYSLWTHVNKPGLFVYPKSGENESLQHSFTVVAFPRITSPPGYLPTFAIREDQTIRVYRPETPYAKEWGEDGDYGAKTWEPIR